VSKLVGEYYCKVFNNLYGMETLSLRYFNVFGPGQDPLSQYSAAIPKFITAIYNKQPLTIYGDGEQSRDFTYVQNVVNANILSCKASNLTGEVVNIACGNEFTLNQIIQSMQKELGIEAQIIYEQPRLGDVKHSCADISKAKKILGYEPVVPFNEGLEKTVAWLTNGHAK
jgi:nucleoside-diphosphate-sugar epimerase